MLAKMGQPTPDGLCLPLPHSYLTLSEATVPPALHGHSMEGHWIVLIWPQDDGSSGLGSLLMTSSLNTHRVIPEPGTML